MTCLDGRGLPGASQVAQWQSIRLQMQGPQEMQVRSLGQEDSPGEGKGHQLQYSCLEHPGVAGVWGSSTGGGAWAGPWSPVLLTRPLPLGLVSLPVPEPQFARGGTVA